MWHSLLQDPLSFLMSRCFDFPSERRYRLPWSDVNSELRLSAHLTKSIPQSCSFVENTSFSDRSNFASEFNSSKEVSTCGTCWSVIFSTFKVVLFHFQDESNFWKQCRSLWRPSSSSWMHHWRRSACSHHIVSRRNESVQDTCPDFVAEFHLIFLWGCVDTYPSSMKNPNLKCSKKSEFDSATCKSCTEPSIGPKSEIVYECPSSAWPCRIHSSTLSAVSFVLQPRKSQIWMEFAVQHYSLQIPCNVRDNNCIFWWTCLLIVLSHSRNRIWKQSCIVDNSQSKRPLVSQIRWFLTIWDEVSTCNRFPSALKAKSTPARRYLWSCVQLNSWLLKCSKVKLLSRTQPGFNIFDAYGLQISSTLSVCAITWSHCLELCKGWARERRARKSCGHHLLHRVVWFATRSTKNTIASGLTFPFCLKMSATWSVVRTC